MNKQPKTSSKPKASSKCKASSNDTPCSYCGVSDPKSLVQCLEPDCKRWFCNNKGELHKSHIFFHICLSKHKTVGLSFRKSKACRLKCSDCGRHNLFSLSVIDFKGKLLLLCSELCMDLPKYSGRKRLATLVEENRLSTHFVKLTSNQTSRLSQVTVDDIKQKELDFGNISELGLDLSQLHFPHVKKKYSTAKDYERTFKPLINYEEAQEIQTLKDLTQTQVQIHWVSNGATIYGELSLYNDDHFHGKLKLGDALKVTTEDSNSQKDSEKWTQEGIVESAEATKKIRLLFDTNKVPSFDDNQTFTVEIIYRNITYERLRQGLAKFSLGGSLSEELTSIILGGSPRSKDKKEAASLPHLMGDLSSLEKFRLNESQKEAAKLALGGSPMSLLQGPPGTGKTKTLTAIIVQLRETLAELGFHYKILVCAPSNVAVDHLAEKLIQEGITDIIRVYAISREKMEVSPVLEEYSLHKIIRKKANSKLRGFFYRKSQGERLSAEEFKDFIRLKRDVEEECFKSSRIVCCTCNTSMDQRLQGFFFKYVFIDEAAQATEPEVLLPLLHSAVKVVLVGDHKQIGPTILCRQADMAGLGKSLFERLITGGTVGHCMLQWQYRMHRLIAEFPSQNFYGGNLKTHPTVSRPVNVRFPWINEKPIVFFDVEDGKEEIPQSGISYMNREEADVVIRKVGLLLQAGVKPSQIGVITPYNGQKIHLINLLKKRMNLENVIEVASVDGFQGREKDYILISCVRSNKELGVGFLKNERRLNVSITRAKFGLMVIGNARMLEQDENWRRMIEFYEARRLIVKEEV